MQSIIQQIIIELDNGFKEIGEFDSKKSHELSTKIAKGIDDYFNAFIEQHS